MRRYRIASWILLILPVFNFTLAAPVATQDIHGVRVSVVDAANDRIAALQKRMEHGDPVEGSSGLSSEHNPPWSPPSDSGSDNSDGSQVYESDNSSGGVNFEEEYQNYEPSDIESDSESDHSESGNSSGGEDFEEEYQNYEPSETESDQAGDHEQIPPPDHEQGPPPDHAQSPPPDHEQGPPPDHVQSWEPQHFAATEFEDIWSKLLKGAMRPRTSGSGAVDVPKRELQD